MKNPDLVPQESQSNDTGIDEFMSHREAYVFLRTVGMEGIVFKPSRIGDPIFDRTPLPDTETDS